MEKKKGRMERVYTADKKPAPPAKVKAGGKAVEPGKKPHGKTPRMGG